MIMELKQEIQEKEQHLIEFNSKMKYSSDKVLNEQNIQKEKIISLKTKLEFAEKSFENLQKEYQSIISD